MPVSLTLHAWRSYMQAGPTRYLFNARTSTILLRSYASLATPKSCAESTKSLISSGQSVTFRHGLLDRQTRNFASNPANPSPSLGGFSYPAPRKLSDIVKLQLLTLHGTERVAEIWNEYHASHKTAFADVLTDSAYNLFRNRIKRCPLFVIPVPKKDGFFTLLVQFQERHCLLTFLEDYKQNAQQASPYLTVTFFEEMLQSKHIALVRADVTNMITKSEAKV